MESCCSFVSLVEKITEFVFLQEAQLRFPVALSDRHVLRGQMERSRLPRCSCVGGRGQRVVMLVFLRRLLDCGESEVSGGREETDGLPAALSCCHTLASTCCC